MPIRRGRWYNLGFGRRQFPSPNAHSALRGPLAQLAEQQTLNLRVEGSIPSRLTKNPQHFTQNARLRLSWPGV
jgi:hypothetical protein